jgi:hypothetical protein
MCLSPAQVAEQLLELRKDALRNAAELEPDDDDKSPIARLLAERDYMDAAHEQLANELRGICSACWLADAEPAKRPMN